MSETVEVRMEPWPKSGPDFNEWNQDVGTFGALLQAAKRQHWWCSDSQLKYLEIRVDTRSGHFVLKDRDGNNIDPGRVVAAIERHRDRFGNSARPASTQTGESITAAALLVDGTTWTLPRPARHHHLIAAYAQVNQRYDHNGEPIGRPKPIMPSEQGFVTDAGRYVSRQEALNIALASGQMTKAAHPYGLFSEDLW